MKILIKPLKIFSKSYLKGGRFMFSWIAEAEKLLQWMRRMIWGHNQFQNIPHYILGSDPQKWAKLGGKNVKTYIKYPFYSI